MLNIKVSNVEAYLNFILEKDLPKKFDIRVGEISQQPYGKEITIIDMAGVCWHFVEQ